MSIIARLCHKSALLACVLLVGLALLTSLGYPLACHPKWVALVRRALRLPERKPPRASPIVVTHTARFP